MKKYRRNRKIKIPVAPVKPERVSLDGDKLVCPKCNARDSIIVRAYETNYYSVYCLESDGSDHNSCYAEWGDSLDSDVSESTLYCGECYEDLLEEEIMEHSLAMREE